MDDPKVVNVENKDSFTSATGHGLSKGLEGTYKERMEEEKSIVLTMTLGKRPEVAFTGFWNFRFIKAAMNSIAKAYRLRRFKPIRPEAENPTVRGEGGKGDV